MKGKEAVCKILEAENVGYIFGNPGSTEVPLLDTLVCYPEIRYVLTLHEGVALAMADGYARASGQPGVVSVHVTPGTANTIGMLYNACVDGVPLVIIAGQQDSRMLIREPFLSADVVEMANQFTKWSWEVSNAEQLPIALRRAFKEATTAPAGPVFLSLPRNVMEETVDLDVVPPAQYRVGNRIRGDIDEIRKAAEIVLGAQDPAIIAGGGVAQAGATPELVALAEMVGARVYGEPGSFPTTHPLYLGPADVRQVSDLVKGADVLLVVGQRMFAEFQYSPAPMLPRGVKAIHLDASSWQVAKNLPLAAAIVADIKVGLKEMAQAVRDLMHTRYLDVIEARTARNREARAAWKKALEQEARAKWDREPICGARLVGEMRTVLPENSVIVEQAIRSATYLTRYFDFSDSKSYLTEHGGVLGWGLAAAVGVKLGLPDRKVFAFMGDGSASYAPQALWTAARYDIPVTFLICKNGAYMAVKSQLLSYQGEAAKQSQFIGTDLSQIDFVKMAESYGVRGTRVERPEQIAPALIDALEAKGPTLLEVVLDPKDAGFGVPRLP
ncbi:MAG: thiamine pyrophosphate-binding protein [Chloroflexi bacterium]|nr:thiamine pyrophosphate-binding protein [Chloroflexota bacterium]